MSKSKSSKKSVKSAPSDILILRKPCAILFDIIGTASKTGFIDKCLMEFITHNVKVYLENEWDDKLVQDDVAKLRDASKKDKGPPIADSGTADLIQKSVAAYVTACIDEQRSNEALFKFRFHMWFHGYKKHKLTTPIYSDVADNMKKWNAEHIKLYVCSNSWKDVSKCLLAQTNHGNLTAFIEDYFDSSIGEMNQRETFVKIAESIKLKPEDILLLTKNGDEARSAHDAGLEVVLVLTHQTDLDRRKEEDKKLPLVRTFNDLQFKDDAPRLSAVQKAFSGKSSSAKSGSRKSCPQVQSKSKPKSKSTSSKSRKSTGRVSIIIGGSTSQEKSTSSKSGKSSTRSSSKSKKSSSANGTSGSVFSGGSTKSGTKTKSASSVSATISSNVKAASGSGSSAGTSASMASSSKSASGSSSSKASSMATSSGGSSATSGSRASSSRSGSSKSSSAASKSASSGSSGSGSSSRAASSSGASGGSSGASSGSSGSSAAGSSASGSASGTSSGSS